MPSAELQYTTSEVKKAGKILRKLDPNGLDLRWAQDVFENWRACHRYPLTQFYDSLSQHARSSSPLTNVVQRPKRLDAVVKKLRKEPQAQLSTMQDIAGCRAIVNSIGDLNPFMSACRSGWSNHELKNVYDYITKPHPTTGYRSMHLVYRFKSEEPSSNGRLVEIQFRSRLQHAWATAVEIIDLFQRETLKGGTGNSDWQRSFALMSSFNAQIERRPPVPATPIGRRKRLQIELRHYAKLLNVQRKIRAYGSLSEYVWTGMGGYVGYSKSGYFVMELDPRRRKIDVRGYSQNEVQKAYEDIATAERLNNPNVVLVAASDLSKLKEAYPNWIIDTASFLLALDYALTGKAWLRK